MFLLLLFLRHQTLEKNMQKDKLWLHELARWPWIYALQSWHRHTWERTPRSKCSVWISVCISPLELVNADDLKPEKWPCANGTAMSQKHTITAVIATSSDFVPRTSFGCVCTFIRFCAIFYNNAIGFWQVLSSSLLLWPGNGQVQTLVGVGRPSIFLIVFISCSIVRGSKAVTVLCGGTGVLPRRTLLGTSVRKLLV